MASFFFWSAIGAITTTAMGAVGFGIYLMAGWRGYPLLACVGLVLAALGIAVFWSEAVVYRHLAGMARM